MVLIFWGVTPIQAGIFATDTVDRIIDVPMLKSTSFGPLDQEEGSASAIYAQSAMNIIWLNETLQPFMTREFVLAPFGPKQTVGSIEMAEHWTAKTTLYSVDVSCERALRWSGGLNSSWGCSWAGMVMAPRVVSNDDPTKIFDTVYVGYSNSGNADYYLSPACPHNESHTFLVQWSKMLVPAAEFNNMEPGVQLQHADVTTLFCRSDYYYQDVMATVALPRMSVTGIEVTGPKVPLPLDIFNTTNFEAAMSVGQQDEGVRTDFATTLWPNQKMKLRNMPLNLNYLPRMAPFAIGTCQRPPQDYLDPEVLRESYESAYRLLFARQMASVVSPALDTMTENPGQRSYRTQSVVLVPVFTYIAEAFLGIVALLASYLVYITLTRTRKLNSDPATISSVMSLVEGQDRLLEEFKSLDRATDERIEQSLEEKRFRLTGADSCGVAYQLQLIENQLHGSAVAASSPLASAPAALGPLVPNATIANMHSSTVKGVQPAEFRLSIGFAFVAFQIASLVLIAVLGYKASHNNGKHRQLPFEPRLITQVLRYLHRTES